MDETQEQVEMKILCPAKEEIMDKVEYMEQVPDKNEVHVVGKDVCENEQVDGKLQDKDTDQHQIKMEDMANQTEPRIGQADVSVQTNPRELTATMTNRETSPIRYNPNFHSYETFDSFETVILISSDEGRPPTPPIPNPERPRRRRRRPLQNIPIQTNGIPIINANLFPPPNRNHVPNPYAIRSARNPNSIQNLPQSYFSYNAAQGIWTSDDDE